MNHFWELAAAAAILVSSGSADAAVPSDITPPQLKSFSFSPAEVDTSTNDQFITITARVTDNLSGLVGFDQLGRPIPRPLSVVFTGPNAGANAYVQGSLRSVALPFDPLDITWTGSVRVARYSHVGTWTLAEIRVEDGAGNEGRFTAIDAQALGAPVSFIVTGIEDRIPPELVSLTVETNKIDTWISHKEIKFSGRILEELSGFGSFDESGRPIPSMLAVRLMGPSGVEVDGRAMLGGRGSVDFEGGVVFPQFSAPGVWRLESAYCYDNAGNLMTISAGSQFARGFEIEVTGRGDTESPRLRALKLNPRRIEPSTSFNLVGVALEANDDLSGLFARSGPFVFGGYAAGAFESPSRKQRADFNLFASGDPLDVVFQNPAYFPPYCERGVWTLRYLSIGDLAGNRVDYEPSELRRLGFPTEVGVGISPQLSITRQGDSLILSWPAWASEFAIESRDSAGAGEWKRRDTLPIVLEERAILVESLSPGRQFYRLTEER